MQLNRSRIISIILVALSLLGVIGGMTRWNDALAKSVKHATGLADIGMFTSAVLELQKLKRLPENKSPDAIKHIDAALISVAEQKANFKNLPAALAAVENYKKQGHAEYGLKILSQVQEATMSHADTVKLAQAFESFKKEEPVVYAIAQAEGLADKGNFGAAQQILRTIRKNEATTPLEADKIRRAQNDLEDREHKLQEDSKTGTPTSDSSLDGVGERGDVVHNTNKPSATPASPSGLSGAAGSQQQDNRSFSEKVSDKLQHWLGVEEPKSHSVECTRD